MMGRAFGRRHDGPDIHRVAGQRPASAIVGSLAGIAVREEPAIAIERSLSRLEMRQQRIDAAIVKSIPRTEAQG